MNCIYIVCLSRESNAKRTVIAFKCKVNWKMLQTTTRHGHGNTASAKFSPVMRLEIEVKIESTILLSLNHRNYVSVALDCSIYALYLQN